MARVGTPRGNPSPVNVRLVLVLTQSQRSHAWVMLACCTPCQCYPGSTRTLGKPSLHQPRIVGVGLSHSDLHLDYLRSANCSVCPRFSVKRNVRRTQRSLHHVSALVVRLGFVFVMASARICDSPASWKPYAETSCTQQYLRLQVTYGRLHGLCGSDCNQCGKQTQRPACLSVPS